MSPPTIVGIGLCGYPKAGKTRAARVLEDHYGASVVSIETLLSDESSLVDDAVEAALQEQARDRLGSSLRTLSVWERRNPDLTVVIIDGVVSPSEVDAYQDACDHFVLAYIRKLDEFRFDYFPADEMATLREADERVADYGLQEIVDNELYDVVIGNDLESNFERKVINAIDGAVFRVRQYSTES